METKKMIEKLYDEFDVEKDGSLLIIHTDADGLVNTYSCGAKNDIASTIAAVVDNALTNDDCAESGKFIAHTIIKGIKAVLSIPSKAGRTLSMYFTLAIADALENVKKGIFTPEDAAKYQDEHDDDDEDCENCNANRICPLPKAIQYRKENHIPAPGRHKRSNKKHCEEKGN